MEVHAVKPYVRIRGQQPVRSELSGTVAGRCERRLDAGPVAKGRAVVSVDRRRGRLSPQRRPGQGSEIKLPIRIDGLASTGVSSYQFDLEYDPMVITAARRPRTCPEH